MKDTLIIYENKLTNKRHIVTEKTLEKYIGVKNANKVILKAEKLQINSTIIKFRKYGKIEIYLK